MNDRKALQWLRSTQAEGEEAEAHEHAVRAIETLAKVRELLAGHAVTGAYGHAAYTQLPLLARMQLLKLLKAKS